MRTLLSLAAALALAPACVAPAPDHPDRDVALDADPTAGLDTAADPALAAAIGALDRHELARASLLAADTLLAATIRYGGQADGLWPWFADDGVYLHPGEDFVTGRAAARAFLRATYPDAAARTLTLHRLAGDSSADARLGYSFGTFVEQVQGDGGATTTNHGKYLATWARGDGAWRLAAFARIASSRAPSPTPADAGIIDGEHGTPAPATPAAVAAAVLEADRAFAALSASSGYTVAFTTYADEDAVVFGGSDFYWGAAGVAYAWSGWSPAESLVWTPLAGRGAGSGDLGFTIGNGTFSYDDGSGAPPSRSYSKYISVWVRQPDGAWRWLLDGGNSRPPYAP